MKVKLLQKPFGVYFILKMFCEYRRRSVFQINQGQRIPIKWESWTHEGGEIIQIKKKKYLERNLMRNQGPGNFVPLPGPRAVS